MSDKVKSVLKYVVLLGLTGLLLWYCISKIEVPEGHTLGSFLLEKWSSADKFFLIGCVFLGLLSHWIRAIRWKILLEPLGYTMRNHNGFLAVMIGYFVNLAIPRGGEVSRCYYLYKLENIPADKSVGTVLAERIVDLIFMIIFIGIAFTIEASRVDIMGLLSGFSLDQDHVEQSAKAWYANKNYYYIAILVGLAGWFLYMFKFKPEKAQKIKAKITDVLGSVKEGALSIFKLKKKGLFLFYSWMIWLCYCTMTYFVVMAFKETSVVGPLGAVTVFTTGGIAMTIPMPGGTGSYHVLVSFVMEQFYAIKNAQVFAFLFHGWQTMVIIVVGAASLITSQILSDSKKTEDPASKNDKG